MLNVAEVKSRYIRDRLNMVVTKKVGVCRAVEVGVVSGNGGNSIESDRLGKAGTEVRIGCATVANEPAGVDVQMHQVCEAQLSGRSSGCASGQGFELAEVDWLGTPGLEIGIEEISVAHFIERVAGDVLWAIGIEVR